MIHLDTSVLIDALTGTRRSEFALESMLSEGQRVAISTTVLFEWLRGPRRTEELDAQRVLFPDAAVVPFDVPAARRAAAIYRAVRSPRGREFDIAIAACAIEHDAALWTRNPADFNDIPALTLYTPPRR